MLRYLGYADEGAALLTSKFRTALVMRFAAFCVFVAASAVLTTISAQSQPINNIDAKCRLDLIKTCYAAQSNRSDSCTQHAKITVVGGWTPVCSNFSYTGNIFDQCSNFVDLEQVEEKGCLRSVEVPTPASIAEIGKILSDTNAILRSDMRLLLNQFCRSYSPRPESCDASIPASK